MEARQRDAVDRLRRRIARLGWQQLSADLDDHGHAVTGPLLGPAECRALQALWPRDELFRSTIDMAPRRFGVGRYRYFAAPLPPLVRAAREALYPPLAAIANRWQRELGRPPDFPPRLAGFLERCRAGGQTRPTPLLLRYEAGGCNHLHQDRYGALAFPLQVALLLSRPGRDFQGGEFLLVEQRPRRQSRGEAIALAQGRAVIFPNAERPVRGARGFHRAQVRHGASRVRAGTRFVLGIIFHDAK
jgi:hypothetical protein